MEVEVCRRGDPRVYEKSVILHSKVIGNVLVLFLLVECHFQPTQ